jgi:predicted Holliday junction resolvase-like endonuclease
MEKEGSFIGDKVDYRVYTQGSDGKVVDIINIEFARSNSDKKFHHDHRKLLREGKSSLITFIEVIS